MMKGFTSKEDYALDHLRVAVSNVLNNIGFALVNEESLNVLIDISRRFMLSICENSKFYAEHAGRTQLIPNDLSLAFRKMQFSTLELYDYLEQVGNMKVAIQPTPRFPIVNPKIHPMLHPPPTDEELKERPIHVPAHFPRMWMPKKVEDFMAVKPTLKKNAPPQFPSFQNMTAYDLSLAKREKPQQTLSVKSQPTPKEKVIVDKLFETPPIVDVPIIPSTPKKKKEHKKPKTPIPRQKSTSNKIDLELTQNGKLNGNASPMPILKREDEQVAALDAPALKSEPESKTSPLKLPKFSLGNKNSVNSVMEMHHKKENEKPEPVKPTKTKKIAQINLADMEPRLKKEFEEQQKLEEKLRIQLLEAEAQARRTARDATPPMHMEESPNSNSAPLKLVISNPHSLFASAVLSPEAGSSQLSDSDTIPYGAYPTPNSKEWTPKESSSEGSKHKKLVQSEDEDKLKKNGKHKKHKKEKKNKKEKNKEKTKGRDRERDREKQKDRERENKKSKNKEKEKPKNSREKLKELFQEKHESTLRIKIRIPDPQSPPIVCPPKPLSPFPGDSNMKLRIKFGDEKPITVDSEMKVPKLKLDLNSSKQKDKELLEKEEKKLESTVVLSKGALKTNYTVKPHKIPKPDDEEKKKRKRSLEDAPKPTSKDPPKPKVKDEDQDSATAESADEEIWICPACSVAWTEGATMIGCDNCDNWFHWHCVGINEAPAEDIPWYCQKCSIKRMKKTDKRQSDPNGVPSKKKKKH